MQSGLAVCLRGVEPLRDVESFSQLPIWQRTIPAEVVQENFSKPRRRVVSFAHIPLHCKRNSTKDAWPARVGCQAAGQG